MIVQPNFLDHWKTNALAAKIGRLEALTALLALWSHCQQQRTWRFPQNELMLAGICRFSGNPRVLLDTLIELNLLEKTPENLLEVHEWAETNAKLLHNWDAGKKGGRPPKQPKDKPTENPRVNPLKTQGEPQGEPIREDKIREENTPLIPQGGDDRAIDLASGIETSASAAETPPPQQAKSEATASRKKKKGGAAHPDLDSIYDAYPKKVGRDAALRAIEKRLAQGRDSADLLQRTLAYARATATWPASERQFIPNPATWFNQGRFDDDAATWTRHPDTAQKINTPTAPQAHWQVKQQAMEDELATLKFSPARRDPDWPWQEIGQQLFGYTWPTAADVPIDNWNAIERHHHRTTPAQA